MKKKYVRSISFFLGILVLVMLTVNFGVNYYLRSKLPKVLKKNTAYNLTYDQLNVDLFTGNIVATQIKVENKNPDNIDVIGLKGSIDTLSISRLGIYQAVFNKRISSSDIFLAKPNLIITLAKPISNKTGKKRNPVLFDNIKISNGNITIFKHTKQKFLAVTELNLFVENIQMTEESVKDKLPIVFDGYDINGKNFYFRPDNIYAIFSQQITTEDGKMSIKNFRLKPLLSQKNFMRFYPDKKILLDLTIPELNFKDILLDDNIITLANAEVINPQIAIKNSASSKKASSKEFPFIVNMENVFFKNTKFDIYNPQGVATLSTEGLTMNVKKFMMDAKTMKSSLPFEYSDFRVSGTDIKFSNLNQNFKIGQLEFNPKTLDIKNIQAKPKSAQGNSLDLTLSQFNAQINTLEIVDKKLKLNIEKASVNNLNGSILSQKKSKANKNSDLSGIHFPLLIKSFEIKNSNLTYNKDNSPLTLKNLAVKMNNLEMNESTAKNNFPFKIENYTVKADALSYRTKFYLMSSSAISFTNNRLQITNGKVKPTVTRTQFIRLIPTERDLYDVSVAKINMSGQWNLFSDKKSLEASNLTLDQVRANIFRSKIPTDDPKEKLLYSSLLKTIDFPLFIKNLKLNNSYLEYEEDTEKSAGPGKLIFDQFTLHAQNLNSGKTPGKPTNIPININTRFMSASPMKVNWSFDTSKPNDDFTIAGNVSDLPASRINPFIEPYLKIRATGTISNLLFNFKGNRNGLNGTLNMKHQDLKVSVLKKDGNKNKLLSAVANLFVKTDSKTYPESVIVDNIPRDKTKSFFNLFWKGVEEGLKKTLIGENVENTEKAVKNTVQNTKETVEKVTKKNPEKEGSQEKKGLRNLFKKKSE